MNDATKKFFRFGIMSKGIVYILIGVLAITASQSKGSKDVIKWLAQQPLGVILLILIATGLLSYGVWRWYRAVKNPEMIGQDKAGTGKRIVYAISGTLYGGLAIFAISQIIDSGNSSGGRSSREQLAGEAMTWPLGEWLVGMVGVALIAGGIYQIYKALVEKYKNKIPIDALSNEERTVFNISAKAGLISRGVVFGVLGYFLIQAAVQSNPQQAGGTGQALSWLQSSGVPWAGLLVAIGLAAYGVYMFVLARYRFMQ